MIRELAWTAWLMSSALADDAMVILHVFRMENPELSTLLSKNLRGQMLMQEIQSKVEAGSIQLHDTKLLRCKWGGRASLLSRSELIYPTEWAAWDLPPHAGVRERQMDRAQGWWAAWPFMPVMVGFTGDFEVRELGESFELSLPSSKRPGPHRNAWSWEWVTRKQDLVHFTQPMLDRPPFESRFPQFETVSLDGQGLIPGTWRIAGVVNQPNEGGEPGDKLLAIMKVEHVEMHP